MVLHHTIADGFSLWVLLRDLAAFYNARRTAGAVNLPELPIQFGDYACWEEEFLAAGARRERLIRYWKERLRDLPTLALPADLPRPQRFTCRGRALSFPLQENQAAALEDFARQCEVTPFIAWLGVLQVLLCEWTGATDIPVGVPTEIRDRAELRDLIGLLVNTLVVRGRIQSASDFASHLRSLQTAFRQDHAHRELPFEMLAQALSPVRDPSRNALFQVMFAFQVEPENRAAISGANWEQVQLDLGVAHFDLHFEIIRSAKKCVLNIEFCTDLFLPATIARLGRRFEALISELTTAPSRLLGDVLARGSAENPPSFRTLQGPQPSAIQDEAPLSYHQQRLWFIDRFETGHVYPSHPTYHNLPILLDVSRTLNPAILEESLLRLSSRHPALRTCVAVRDESPCQVIVPPGPVPLALLPEALNRDEAVARALAFASQPFSLESAPLLRAALIPFGVELQILVLAVHHLVADKRSLEIIARDLAASYEALRNHGEPSWPVIPFGYLDFTNWQQSLPSAVLETLRAFWSAKLAGRLPALELPTDRPRHAVHLYRQERITFLINPVLRQRLAQLASSLEVSLEAVLLSGFRVLLFRYSRQPEIILGIVEPFREHGGDLVGPLANLLVLRQELAPAPFSSTVAETARELAAVRGHAAYPFDLLVQELNPEKDMSRTAMFDVLFQFEEAHPENLSIGGCAARWIETNLGFGKYDLNLSLRDDLAQIEGHLVYNGELFDRTSVERMLGHLLVVLERVALDADVPLGGISLLNEQEARQIHLWNDTAASYPRTATIHGLFSAQANRHPDRIAVSDGPRRLSYREVERRANRLAYRLIRMGVTPDQLVAVCLERSPDLIVVLLAVLKAGGAYLPLEPDLPEARLRFILDDAGARIVIVDRLPSKIPLDDKSECLAIGNASDWFAEESDEPPSQAAGAGHLAYCIYTSGSTGRPKGVLVEHRNVVRLLVNDRLNFHFDETDVWSLFHSPSFDFSVWEMYGALLYGGRVVIVPKPIAQNTVRFLELLVEEGVTVLNQTPTAFYHLADEALQNRPRLALRYVIFGGEALNPLRLGCFHEAYPATSLVNMYGITETTVHVTYKALSVGDLAQGTSNVGRPIPTTTCYILDEQQAPLPVGIPGEIYVGGDGVARGYLNRPELSREKFVPSPFRAGERLYRSGDVGKLLPNGEIVYLGRLDAQVQVRGFRVELGEVQSRLLQHPAVRDAVITARPLKDGSTGLFAYVVPTGGLDLGNLRAYLGETLPDYMIPAVFVKLDRLPMTSNGKVALDELPDPWAAREDAGPTGEAAAPQEEFLAGIWAEVLGCETVRPEDDFFALGGYSLLATRLLARVQHEIGLQVPLRLLFEAPRLRDFARRVAELAPGSGAGDSQPIISLKRDAPAQPSPTQVRLWFIQQLNRESRAYHLFGAVRLRGESDLAALRRALAEVQSRHQSLRASFREIDGTLAMPVASTACVPLSLIDLSHWPVGERESQYQRAAREFARKPFALDQAPLLRVQLFHLGDDDTRLVAGMHHVIADGWSLEIFLKEMSLLYHAFRSGRPSPLPALPFQFCDWAAWQEKRLNVQRRELLLAHWSEALREIPALELPVDRPRPSLIGDDGAMHGFVLGKSLASKIGELAREQRASPFMIGMAAFQLLLARYSGKSRFAVGFPVANRERIEAQEIIGCLVNTLALPATIDETETFATLLQRVREETLVAHAHQDLPFEALVDALKPSRDPSTYPIFQVLFNFQEAIKTRDIPGGFRLDETAIDIGSAQFELALYLEEDADAQIRGVFVYRSDLLHESTVRRFATHYVCILEQAVQRPHLPLNRSSLLTGEETEQRRDWNATAMARGPQTLHGLFELQVRRTPERTAVQFTNQSMTYAELDRASSRLASALRRQGIGRECIVGVCLERSLEMIVALLGILKAGAAYLPLDPELPGERLRRMLEIAGASLTITVPEHADVMPAGAGPVMVLDLQNLDANAETSQPVDPLAAAYVLFTSGSTGEPKGVVIPHAGIVNRLLWMQETYQLGMNDRVLQKTPFTFDVSLWDLFWPLISGARLVFAKPGGQKDPAYLVEVINACRITVLHFVPSMLEVFLQHRDVSSCRSLRHVICSGEALSPGTVQRFFRLGLPARLHNLYGPTEASVDVSAWECSPDSEETIVPIGRPIANTQLHILDRYLRPVPAGMSGELYIGGMGLARGYSHRPGMTGEVFIPDPFSELPGQRLYRTGDLARFREDGAIEFLGRADTQVKIRGLRIELGEIERVLAQQTEVAEVAVVVRPGDRLTAYVVLAGTHNADWKSVLAGVLQARLPAYMIPADWICLDRLPLTRHGKLNRAALPVPAEPPPRCSPGPRSAMERLITSIWEDLLGRREIALDQNFFDAGGNSLLLIQVHLRLREHAPGPLELVELFRHPTIASLAAFLTQQTAESSESLPDVPPLSAKPAAHDIAIIGMAGRFPNAKNLEEFWENLAAGRPGIRVFTPEELLAAGVEPSLLDDPRFVPAGGALDGVDLFDADYFGYSPAEAALLDPQGRVFMECADEVLQAAGIDPARGINRIGVFAGSSLSSYLSATLGNTQESERFAAILGADKDYLATRVSYKLGLRGPSITVQTACSTSLVAVHLACQSLRQGACEMSLAGGVSIAADRNPGYFYEEGGILSPDGHCRAFDVSAQGTVPGQGCGIVLLKPLEHALRDGDPILAVIKGSAVNNDGAGKVGFTAPSVQGQVDVIRAALADAGAAPSSISYIEAHGTGTPLGDLVEISALKTVFTENSRCRIGSLKSTLGHLDAAAGVAGLIKTVLCLQHGALPPSLHCMRPNPALDSSGLAVNTTLRTWDNLDGPRRAGVSAFGLGGSNAHVVLEAAPRRPAPALPPTRAGQLIVLSAHSEEALECWSNVLASALAQTASSSSDFAFALQSGRRRFAYRRAFVASTREQLLAGLNARVAATRLPVAAEAPRVAFLFPGQGEQHAGMGAACYATEPVFRETVDRCLAALPVGLREAVFRLYFVEVAEPAEAQPSVHRTDLVQPGLFIFQIAMVRLWQSWGVRPQAVLGHSLGELAAAAAAGVLSDEAGAALAAERGRVCQELPVGGMLAVSLDECDLALPPELDLAAVNGPRLCTVSGPLDALTQWAADLKLRRIPCLFLSTDRAFHSRAVEPAIPRLEAAWANISFHSPIVPFLTMDGLWASPGDLESPAYWSRQLRHTVRFSDSLAQLASDDRLILLEIGPGESLARMARRSIGRRVASGDSSAHPLHAAADLWKLGVELDWKALHGPHRPARISLPAYPYQRRRHWHSVPTASPRRSAPGLYRASWTATAPFGVANASPLTGRECLLRAAANCVRAASLTRALQDGGVSVMAKASATSSEGPPTIALFVDEPSEPGFYRLLEFARELGRMQKPVELTVLTQRGTALTGGPVPSTAMLFPLALVIAQEYPQIQTQVIDTGDGDMEPGVLLTALARPVAGRRLAIVGRTLFERRLVELAPGDSGEFPFPKGGVCLLTGGLGKIGRALARHLARTSRARLFLCGRSPLDEEGTRFLVELAESGSQATYDIADLCAEGAARTWVTNCLNQAGAIHGVIHAAGIAGEEACFPLEETEKQRCEAVFGPKIAGTSALLDALDGLPVAFFAACSSLSTELGGLGFGAYAAGNAALDALIEQMSQTRPDVRWLSIAWDGWDFTKGKSSNAVPTFTATSGVAMWDRILRSDLSGPVAAVVGRLEERLDTWVRRIARACAQRVTRARHVEVTSTAGTPTEEILSEIWKELLGTERVGLDDDFLELGGHSLLATQMMARIAARFSVKLGLRDILEAPTIARLAALIESTAQKVAPMEGEKSAREEGEL
jgi:amino acid adenylation domain-containing protein